MKKLITLPLLISMTGLLFANQSLAITQSQMQMRATATCDSYASMSRIASPGVVYEVCLNGAKESMQGRNSACESKIRQFNKQADTLHGMERAEYIEISQAYRMGCNVGKQTPKINSENKQAIAKPLSQKEIEERQEIQNYSMEIRNAFSQIRSGSPDLTGQKCSIKVWFSQSGNVLSIKVESGDNDACSYVLKRTQKIKLSAMNDSQYKVFRNTPIDFSF
ncbi:hypothetical protein NFY21_000313 [Salmonella enterica]|nr:hypothetical protein [Salmonella enterica subsp. enterica serovar Infantis]EJH6214048.1 hypothetical protein [Salmonella enterica]EKK7503002.1 hypothetical protein [Salmonella enterica subsp. enterica serovar Infantis]EKK8044971.1 hypothetical protein [Salmonella enterica]ELQ0494375.1 hypothetical protein [Salmonella enterica]